MPEIREQMSEARCPNRRGTAMQIKSAEDLSTLRE